jgi:hypothetical protein
MTKPDDIDQDAWEKVWVQNLRMVISHQKVFSAEWAEIFNSKLTELLAAPQVEREACAALAEQIGDEYGEDEPRWLECTETVAAAIRNRP